MKRRITAAFVLFFLPAISFCFIEFGLCCDALWYGAVQFQPWTTIWIFHVHTFYTLLKMLLHMKCNSFYTCFDALCFNAFPYAYARRYAIKFRPALTKQIAYSVTFYYQPREYSLSWIEFLTMWIYIVSNESCW